MRRLIHLAALAPAAMALAACTTAKPVPQQATAPAHPLGIISSGPPGDTSFSHLRCLPTTEAGPGIQCTRHD